jgi:hypothetical protein
MELHELEERLEYFNDRLAEATEPEDIADAMTAYNILWRQYAATPHWAE